MTTVALRRLGFAMALAAPLVHAACASAPLTPRNDAQPQAATSSAQRAAEARAEALRERTTPVVDHIELRVRDLSVDRIQRADGVELALRLPFADNPWFAADAADAWQAQARAELAAYHEVAHEDAVEACERAAHLGHHSATLALYQRTAAGLAEVERWAADWSAAGSLDELSAAELELELARWHHDARPALEADAALLVDVDTRDLLPTHTTPPDDPLRTEPDLVHERIQLRHPAVARHHAQADAHQHERAREESALRPWLEFVELGYRLGPGRGPDEITLGLAVAFPFGLEASAEIARYDALATSERFEADATRERLQRQALDALAALSDAESQARDTTALLAAADRAEDVALRWIEQRLGEPRQAARVLREVHDARLEALEAQRRAGEAACALFEATATPLAEWPRGSRP